MPADESSTTDVVATDHEDIVAPTTTGVKGVDLPTEEAFRPPKTLTRALSREPDVDARLQEWAASQSSELLKVYLGTLYAAGAPAAQLRPLHQELARRPIKDLVAEGVGLSRAARHDRRLQRPQQRDHHSHATAIILLGFSPSSFVFWPSHLPLDACNRFKASRLFQAFSGLFLRRHSVITSPGMPPCAAA